MKPKKTRNYFVIFISIFLALIMVTSILGYIFMDRQENAVLNFKGTKFTYNPSTTMWQFRYQNLNHQFKYYPEDLMALNYSKDIALLAAAEIDATYDPEDENKGPIASSIFTLANHLSSKNIYVRQGFIVNNSYGLPIIGCEESSPFVPVIYYRTANQTMAYKQGDCIIIESENDESFLRYSERLAYQILGIME
jgi:hypothetical protein